MLVPGELPPQSLSTVSTVLIKMGASVIGLAGSVSQLKNSDVKPVPVNGQGTSVFVAVAVLVGVSVGVLVKVWVGVLVIVNVFVIDGVSVKLGVNV
jgi:hypothetical protein